MMPDLSAPVIRTVLFTQDKITEFGEGLVNSDGVWNPSVGRDSLPDADAHDPSRFRPTSCSQWCCLVTQSFFSSCMAGCRR
jgi:hypothetical protein